MSRPVVRTLHLLVALLLLSGCYAPNPGRKLDDPPKPPEPDGFDSRLIEAPVFDPGNVKWTSASADYRFAAAVAAAGMVLRDSEFAGQADYDLVDAGRRRAGEGGGR